LDADGFFSDVANIIEQASKYVGRVADLTMFGFLEKKQKAQKSQTMFSQSYPFTLGWSH
jgi:hypothetical protein